MRGEHGFVGRHVELADRQQRAGMLQQFVALWIGRHAGGQLENRRIGVDTPEKRDHREVENGHPPHVDSHAADPRDPLHNPQRGIQRPVGVDLDHHLEPRLHDMPRNLGVNRCREVALVDPRLEWTQTCPG